MPGPIATDTPDYQRGLFNPQALLAIVPANTGTITVGIPTNAETLIVVAASIADGGTVYAEGVSTLYKYQGYRAWPSRRVTSAPTWFFDVSSAMDEQVTITWVDAPGQIWFVYADAAAHIIADTSSVTDSYGQKFVVPSTPGGGSTDHPANELIFASAFLAASTNLVGAAGVGQRYRVFAAQLAPNAASVAGYLTDASTGRAFLYGSNQAGQVMNYLPSGIALATNGAIGFIQDGGSGNMYASVVYTSETA